ncbi:RNA polymerase sigma factor [Rubricoccus marinus]|uniref:HTH luxR-type domain-containing protein n=1 Tax=Rubricoccus marinus TaxID=716817 RepID=A0A259TXY4_9BACT|nr:sigma-70 family RNA polymerase sigma factor [Rubricoccus marinus]OZC02635.1 hypothetical protein BSZ36_06390 [Rubricoccus marinus]
MRHATSSLAPQDDLVRRHADLVYRVVLNLLRDADEAADAAQEALVKVWRGCAEIPETSQRAWCCRVARNCALDHIRRRRSRPQPAHDPQTLMEPLAETPSPEEDAESAEFQRELDRALATLDEPYRSIVILREVEGLAYQEVADTLDLPLNTMKVYLHRAKRRLREALVLAAPDLIPIP